MSRFFKSAAFPILIVVVLAFFAQRLISPSDQADKPTFRDFNAQLDAGEIRNVDMKNKDNTVEVTLRDGRKYKVGFADDYGGILTNRLIAAQEAGKLQDYNIEGRQSNGWLSLLTYVLPFLIFIGFWIFLMNQV
jgi:cell division protease FtsH